jgi:hypothetical protein
VEGLCPSPVSVLLSSCLFVDVGTLWCWLLVVIGGGVSVTATADDAADVWWFQQRLLSS